MSLFKAGRDTIKFKCLKSLLSHWQAHGGWFEFPHPQYWETKKKKKSFSVEVFKTSGILKVELNVYYEIVWSLWG